VKTLYVIAVMTSLNCGVDVICFRAVEPDSTGQHAKTYPTKEAIAEDSLTTNATAATIMAVWSNSQSRCAITSHVPTNEMARAKAVRQASGVI
jgi:hypothetical protein